LAGGDYSSLGQLLLDNVNGTAAQPRIVQFDSDLISSAIAFAEASDSDLPTLPPTVLTNSPFWQFVGVRWSASSAPLTVIDSDDVVVDRARIATVSVGVSVRNSDRFQLQRSLITGSEIESAQCIDVELEAGGSVSVTNSEYLGCHRALSVSSLAATQFAKVLIAGNEFHRTAAAGDGCDVAGVSVDGSGGASLGSLEVLDNHFSGWTANSNCIPGSGSAVHLSDRTDGVALDRNVLWNSARGLSIDATAGQVELRDNVIVGDESGHAVHVGTGTGRVSMHANHFVRHARWLESDRPQLTSSCNLIVSSGSADAPITGDTTITRSSYFAAAPGVMASPDGADQQSAFALTTLAPLCLTSNVLSDPRELCLDDAARDPASVQCGSDHWVTGAN
ncbi:MAG: hypothetical protein AAF499_01415, partial [Pseudomonadota bacterium]